MPSQPGARPPVLPATRAAAAPRSPKNRRGKENETWDLLIHPETNPRSRPTRNKYARPEDREAEITTDLHTERYISIRDQRKAGVTGPFPLHPAAKPTRDMDCKGFALFPPSQPSHASQQRPLPSKVLTRKPFQKSQRSFASPAQSDVSVQAELFTDLQVILQQ